MPRKSATSERLNEFEERLARIEEALHWLLRGRLAGKGQLTEAGELTVEPWKYLVRRPHPWRRQLYLRGRNMTARQLVGGVRANRLDEERAAANYRLPVEAVREALAYVEANKSLLEDEAEIERLMLKREGVSRGPQPVS
jgi:uncharacterized protein (DUF433 family)